MKLKAVLIAATIFATTNYAFSGDTEYQIIAYKDCQLVLQQQLNAEQQEAYLKLQGHELKMEELEAPLKDFEIQMEELGKEMEEVTKIAFHEDDETVVINKSFAKKTEEIGSKMQDVVAKYQVEIDQISKFGTEIGIAAGEFTESLQADIEDVEYDYMNIIPANEIPEIEFCGKNKSIHLM